MEIKEAMKFLLDLGYDIFDPKHNERFRHDCEYSVQKSEDGNSCCEEDDIFWSDSFDKAYRIFHDRDLTPEEWEEIYKEQEKFFEEIDAERS